MSLNYRLYQICELRQSIRILITRIKIAIIKVIAGTDHIMIGFKIFIPKGKSALFVSDDCLLAYNYFTTEESESIIEA